MGREGCPDIDAVLTTRELAQLLRIHGELGRKAVYAKDRAFKPARVTCACCCA